MYRFSYAEILGESGVEGRGDERLALDHAIELLTQAQANGPSSPEAAQAVLHLQKLWGFLIHDLADPHNELADALRGNLISIGLWIIKEADQIVQERSSNFAGLIEVNRTIRDGLM
ncbi:flagellar biosynthesis regulator FlaF [Ancylobacter dichloromethanicus]|uniref:Flagellar FlaF family protein n=1 Tax=Ancylobacter dichloromethanicus TaxID=518825 RepID=A0A9W6J3M4_9HYPH|nr:flagellar biosynthesis regulator FlaF [Ancylobacter dichloromethanicus]MBS7556319.1 flagellar biosynthesis regulator FlaF [Ancylobacter dichloromethanicus]GLK70082.1 flagellar FlaF family protein [Ancylobacter dichloromethanicus]